MPENKRVLSANSEFYKAFHDCNFDKMNDIWSRREDITVIHPGYSPLLGRDNVLTSWRQILSPGQSFAIHSCNATAFVNDNIAYVICNETLPNNTLIATNIFILEDSLWRLVHHQAGPVPDLLDETPTGRPH